MKGLDRISLPRLDMNNVGQMPPNEDSTTQKYKSTMALMLYTNFN